MTPQPPSQQQQQQISPVGGGAETVREQDKPHLVLAYILGLFLIPLLTVKDSPFVQWHAKQGMVLSLVGLASLVIAYVPVLGYVVCPLWVGMAVMAVMAIVKAFAGQRWRIPVIADLAEKF